MPHLPRNLPPDLSNDRRHLTQFRCLESTTPGLSSRIHLTDENGSIRVEFLAVVLLDATTRFLDKAKAANESGLSESGDHEKTKPSKPPSEEYQRFESLVKQVIAVSKVNSTSDMRSMNVSEKRPPKNGQPPEFASAQETWEDLCGLQ